MVPTFQGIATKFEKKINKHSSSKKKKNGETKTRTELRTFFQQFGFRILERLL